MKFKYLDASFFILATISLLNLNGAILMAVGIPQAGSPFMLIACLVLVWRLGGTAMPLSAKLLIATLVSYLLFAIIFAVFSNDGTTMDPSPLSYAISILMLWAVMAYMRHSQRDGGGNRVLRLVRNLSVLAAVSILASPFLYTIFQQVPASAQSRFGGFFGNPNEAGVMACVLVGLTLSEPFRSRSLQIIAILIGSIATFLTFSKTAWFVLIAIFALHLMQRSRRNPYLLIMLLAFIPTLAFFDLVDILEWFRDNPFFELDLTQTRRIDSLIFVFKAQAEFSSALTSRDLVWQFGIEKIMQNPVLGSGLGSFHHLEGVLEENGVWQGVHNTYLMVWGEAGVLVFALFVITTLIVARDLILHYRHPAAAQLAMIIFANSQVNHNILTSRYFIVLIGVLVCLQARQIEILRFKT